VIKKALLFFLILLFLVYPVWADQLPREETLKGRVEKVLSINGQQSLRVEIIKGSKKGKIVDLPLDKNFLPKEVSVREGDLVLLSLSHNEQGQEVYYFADFVRSSSLASLLLVFVILVILAAGWQGVASLLGLAFSFLVVLLFLLPQISTGRNPVLITIVSFLAIVPLSFYLSHGLNRKTTIAILGTAIALGLTVVLAWVEIDNTKLSGLVSEEIGFLQSINPGLFNGRSLLLAGMIIGILGVLDDVTVSQVAIVQQLKEANPQFSPRSYFGER
jgi:uncharacterized membrane protein